MLLAIISQQSTYLVKNASVEYAKPYFFILFRSMAQIEPKKENIGICFRKEVILTVYSQRNVNYLNNFHNQHKYQFLKIKKYNYEKY